LGYLDEVAEHEPRREPARAVVGELQQPAHPLGGARQHHVLDALGAAAAEQGAVVGVGLEQVGAGDHHPLHRAGAQQPRSVVRHEPAVARAGHRHARRPGRHHGRHELRHRLGLVGLGDARGRRRGRAAEEEEVRDDEAEPAGQRAHLAPPLPRRRGAEAVEEDEHGARVGAAVGPRREAPAVDRGGAAVEGHRRLHEARRGEAAAEVGVEQRRDAECRHCGGGAPLRLGSSDVVEFKGSVGARARTETDIYGRRANEHSQDVLFSEDSPAVLFHLFLRVLFFLRSPD
jgi:hypothetical protein